MAPRGKKPAAGESEAPARKKGAAGRAAAPARRKVAELPAQPRPDAPLDSQAFLRAAQPVLRLLEADLLERARGSAAIARALAEWHASERKDGRTSATLDEWQRDYVVQVAAAWLLSCVFVRTLEDRGAGAAGGAGLLGHGRIAGPGAMDSQRQFFDLAPSLTERDYLLAVFREMTRLPGVRDTFDARHNPVWKLGPSAQATRALLALFRAPEPEAPAFRFGQADTRFLGDLYQDLSEDVRKRFALLQTPAFVESFILDRTLERAVHQFGVADTTVIDPTCGSGHFLLGAFDRLYQHRLRAQPDLDPRQAALLALDAVFGADINAYAVAIARFRLTLAFIDKAGFKRIKLVPRLPLHLVVADSLLHNPQHAQASFADMAGQSARTWGGDALALDDEQAARDVLHRRFTAVVGNPPYITVKDAALRERYRGMYTSAAGKYSLGVPFTERFFQLARPGGYAGMITSNAFMKREFGKKLIENVLPGYDLDLIVNTAGAYIPGHGTPTVLLFGVNRQPEEREVLAVLSKRGEPSTPENPEQGLVWQSITGHWNDVGHDDDFISVARVERTSLAKHPWSLGGGGAGDLKELLEERAEKRLDEIAASIGISSFTLEDDVFLQPADTWPRLEVPEEALRPMVIGEAIRDWAIDEVPIAFFPYTKDFAPINDGSPVLRVLWPYRTALANNKLFGGKTKVQGGLKWYEYGRLTSDKLRTPLTITFPFVATHNHFVLDRGGKVFNRTAPIVKLPETATEDDHLALLAYLNSSTACFWMKQVFYPKATSTGDISVEKGRAEANRYEFTGTGLKSLPLPALTPAQRSHLVFLARTASTAAEQRERLSPRLVVQEIAGNARSAAEVMAEMEQQRDALLLKLVALQEEIDWFIYRCFGLVDQAIEAIDQLADPDLRPFCFVNREPSPTLPEAWRRRHAQLMASPDLQLVESPMYKRLWSGRRGVFGHGAKSFSEQIHDAAIEWIQSQAEQWLQRKGTYATIRDIATGLLAQADVKAVASQLLGQSDAASAVAAVLRDGDAVPYLPYQIYEPSGLSKHAEWQKVWQMQRDEDAGQQVGEIPVPPKYAIKDFKSQLYWRLRGKLNVPREQFISYPGCESEHDALPVYGWAGWNHLQRMQALALLYQDRKRSEGWPAERLVPMLAGMLELLPWVKQWHNDPDPAYDGLRMGDYFEGFVKGQCDELGVALDDVRTWRPAARTARRGGKTASRKPDADAGDTTE